MNSSFDRGRTVLLPYISLDRSKQTNKYLLFSLLYIGWIIDFLDRMVMSVALTSIGKDLHLTEAQLGILLSSFFVGFALMQIPGGYLADKFGSKKVMVFSIVIWSLFTLLTGLAWSLLSLLIVRFIFGLCEACFPAAATKCISENFKKENRGKAQAIMLSSNPIGVAIAPIIAAPLIITMGWRNVFIILSVVGFVVAILYAVFIKPTTHDKKTLSKEKEISLKDLIKMPTIWKLAIMNFGVSAVSWGFSSWLPSYLLKVRHLELVKAGMVSSLPFIAGTISMVLSGWLLEKTLAGKEKYVAIITGLLSAIFLFSMFRTSSLELAIVFQVLTAFFLYFNITLLWSLPHKIIPSEVIGSAAGTINFGGQVAGVVTPAAMGFLISSSNGSYNTAFSLLIIAMLVCVGAATTLSNTKKEIEDPVIKLSK